jgi:ubiquinone/menaquinone biosynthesis C-methylase UbiE
MALASYQRFADAYDWEGSLDFSRQAFRRVQDLCERFGLRPGRHLDLGCGTGTLAILMAEAGWDVSGLDRSEAMLARAGEKARAAGQKVELLQQDMRSLQVSRPVHLVTAMYDTVNHLLFPEDLEAVFQGVARVLSPGGLLIFDVNSEATFQQIWGGATHFVETSQASTVYRLTYDRDSRLAKGLVTGFLRRDGHYERFQEEIVERYWPPDALRDRLEAAGLRPQRREVFNPFPLPGGGDLKWLWIADRR